jgi:hypothetical protein
VLRQITKQHRFGVELVVVTWPNGDLAEEKLENWTVNTRKDYF